MKYLMLIFILLLSFGYLKSQNFIKGVLIDNETSTSIPLAHIYLKNHDNYGTVSNEQGRFIFYFPSDFPNDTIVISAISYKSVFVPISHSRKKDSLVFLLDKDVKLLEEFTITPYSSDDSVKVIVGRAMNKIKVNYASKLHFMSGFFREVSITESKYSRLLEAAVNIQDNGLMRNNDDIEKGVKIEVVELRKSDDMKAYHTGLLNMHEILGRQFKTNNMLLNLYQNNNFKVRNEFKDFEDNYKFDFSRMENLNEEKVIVIAFKSNFGKYNGVMSNEGLLYINLSDFAIVKMITKHFTFGNENGTITIQFKRVNKKYYPLFIEHTRKDFSKPKIAQYKIATLMINEVIIERSKIDKIKKRFAESGENDLYKKEMPYNAKFWQGYNILLLAPITDKMNNDLEIQKNLDTQFRNNSKNR